MYAPSGQPHNPLIQPECSAFSSIGVVTASSRMVIEILRSPELLDWPAVDTHVRDASAGIVVLLLRGAALVIGWSSPAVVIDDFL
jgi:hypothetical protein